MVMQQLSGINTVMYYSTEILSGVIPTGARYISLLVAVANCVLTLAPMVLVSYIGRKSLLLISSALCGFTTCALGLGIRTNSPLIAGVMVIAFVSSFSLGRSHTIHALACTQRLYFESQGWALFRKYHSGSTAVYMA